MHWVSPEAIADRLEWAKPNGRGFIGRCPAHEDSNPSFVVTEGEKGTIMRCHAGCDIHSLCEALQIRPEQLFYDVGAGRQDDTFGALQALIQRHRKQDLWQLETLGDVMQAALETDVLTEEEWVEVRTYTGIEWGWYVSMPYPEAMRYWSVISNGLLADYLHKWWLRKDRPDWNVVKHHAHRRMRKVWMDKGAR